MSARFASPGNVWLCPACHHTATDRLQLRELACIEAAVEVVARSIITDPIGRVLRADLAS